MVKFRRLLVALVVMGLLSALAGCGKPAATAENKKGTPEDALKFYKDKNVNFIVPYATGGGYDRYARLIAPYLQKYLPGITVVVRNVPGAGSLTGTNELYLSKTDGLTIGVLNGVGATTAQAVKQEGVKYDLTKFNYLGRFNNDPKVVVAKADGPIKSFEDLKKMDKLQVSVNGVGSSEYVGMEVLKKVLLPKLDIVSGYNTTAEGEMAMLRGEVNFTSGSIGSKLPLIESKKAIPLLTYSKKKYSTLPGNVPIATELVSGSDKKLVEDYINLLELGRPIVTPPGVPEERIQVLREAMTKSLSDPEFLDKAKQAKLDIETLDPKVLSDLVQKSLQMPEDLKNLMAKALANG